MARRAFRIAQVIAINAVPLIGFFGAHWSAGTVLALYWFENLAASFLIAIRVWVHRKLTNKRGHYVLNVTKTKLAKFGRFRTTTKRSVGTVLQGFLLVAIGLTIGQGLFLAVIINALPESAAFDPAAFRIGATSISIFLLIGFILDLGGIRQRPFGWIRVMTSMMYFRVIVIQFTAVFGIGLIAIFNAPRAAVLLFMILKLLVDLLGTQIKDEIPVEGDEDLPFDAEARAKLLASSRPLLPK